MIRVKAPDDTTVAQEQGAAQWSEHAGIILDSSDQVFKCSGERTFLIPRKDNPRARSNLARAWARGAKPS